MKKYIDYLKAIGEETRLRIIRLLLKAKVPLCVCEIMDCINESQTNVSKHLKILKYCGLVKEKKEGKFVMYHISEKRDEFLKILFKIIDSIPDRFFKKDEKCLKKRLSLRKNGKCVIGIRR